MVIDLQEIRGTREVWLAHLDDQTRVQLSHLRTLDHTQELALSIVVSLQQVICAHMESTE